MTPASSGTDPPTRRAPFDKASPDPAFAGSSEYEVVRLGLQPLTLAYGAFAALVTWVWAYEQLRPRGPWTTGIVVGLCLALAGSLAAWRARKRSEELTLAILIALILDIGALLTFVIPIAGFYLVLMWPR